MIDFERTGARPRRAIVPGHVFVLALFVFAPAAAAQGGPGGGFPNPPVPPQNPITPAKVNLGWTLFWDEQLSSTRTVACGTCHLTEVGGSDPRSATAIAPGADGLFGTGDDVHGSPGVVRSREDGLYVDDPLFGLSPQVTPRKTPSMIDAAFAPLLFWDGRASGTFLDPLTGAVVIPQGGALESQAAAPPVSDVEMGHEGRAWQEVADRVALSRPLALAEDIPVELDLWIGERTYPELFAEAFGTPAVTPVRILMAIATYERTLVSDQTPFDRFVLGDPTALTPQEQAGLNLFNSPQTGCGTCHGGPLFSDQGFHYTGVRPPDDDLGRFLVTGNPADRGRMKTPTLRNVGLREPLFHDGSAATLEEVIEFYDRGGDFDAPNKAPQIRPLGLTPGQKAALVAFLRNALTDPRVAAATAPFQRPTLFGESDRVPTLAGAGTPGSGGVAPRMVALEPGLVGNPSLTFGVEDALGGAPAILLLSVGSAAPPMLRSNVFLTNGGGPASLFTVPALDGLGPGEGTGSYAARIPAEPSLAGRSLRAQWLVVDPGAPAGFAASPVAHVPMF